MNIQITLLLTAALLITVALSQPLADRVGLSPAVLLALVGITIGTTSMALSQSKFLGFASVAGILANFPIHSDAFLFIFLPMLVFEAGLNIEVRRMIEDAAPILMLAVVAVLVSTVLIGASLIPLTNVPAVACFMLASMVATTDPVAVIAIFRDVGAPSRVSRLVEGESLLNDAAAITIFLMLIGNLLEGNPLRVGIAALGFLRSFGGGIAVGFVGARVVASVMRWLLDIRLAQVTVTLALPYLVFIVAERQFGFSGVMATLTAGLVMSASAQRRMAPDDWHFLHEMWEQLAFWGSSLIFLFASLLIPRMLLDVDSHDLKLLSVMIAAAFLARGIVVFGLLPLMTALRVSPAVDNRFKAVIFWGGLRGALTLVLALSVSENPAVAANVRHFVAILATGFVLFTLLVNGTTLRLLIRMVGLNRLSDTDQALRDQVLKLSRDHVSEATRTIGSDYEFADPLIQEVVQRRAATEANHTAGLARERHPAGSELLLGLAATASRERELVIEHFAQRTISGRVLEDMLAFVGRLVDRSRAGNQIEYLRVARNMVDFSPRFRLSHWVHRQLGIEGPLVDSLADRFESLLIQRIVLRDLGVYFEGKLVALLDSKAAAAVREVLEARREMTETALDALRRQYPIYAEELERRILSKVWLQREEAEYRALYDDGVIGPELYSDLRRGVQLVRSEVEHRPPLDLGLNTRHLIVKVPIFAQLTEAQLDAIAYLLQPRFAVPGERLIRDGDRADAMYFISSGSVEVDVIGRKIQLGAGDFFGEMALISGRRRRGNVNAVAYCQLLILKEKDFKHLLRNDESIQRQILMIASERIEMDEDARKAGPN